jgi:ABC-type nitrate/sulfonate/bicarbonate transport system ATPase subunit
VGPLFFCAKNISKSFEGVPTIENISLNVGKGESVALLGVSGVGKTTLFNILSGLSRPDSGQVFLEGEDITGSTGKTGYMQQKDLLLPFKTVLENICLPLRLKGVPKRQAFEQVKPLLPKFGLAGCSEKYPSQLSGGMRQRAALLRTYLFSNRVFLLDEPFSALDALTKTAMHNWYLDVISETGASTLFITHDIDEAIFLSDRIYIMTGRPGTVTKEIGVGYGKKRSIDFTTTEEFRRCKEQILSSIGQDMWTLDR